jgi:hypothetical protein
MGQEEVEAWMRRRGKRGEACGGVGGRERECGGVGGLEGGGDEASRTDAVAHDTAHGL